MKRMDRYKDMPEEKSSRTENNKDLYQNVSNNTRYTNISDVTNANAYEINDNITKEKLLPIIKENVATDMYEDNNL